jgi:membrane-bound lytic murein transglycosylase A
MLNKLILLFLTISSVNSFALSKMPPMQKLNANIEYSDDLAFEYMLKAITRQERYFKKADLSKRFKFGNRTVKREVLRDSLIVFKSYVVTALNCFQINTEAECLKTFNTSMNRSFDAYRPLPAKWERGFKDQKTLFTAYYSPDLHGSKTKTGEYVNPIYAKPVSTKLQKVSSDQINFGGALANRGLELFYVKESKYDIWLLHVEGGGRVRVEQEDGSFTHHYLSYDGANKQSFNMLYKYMLAEGMLKKGEATIANQRKYFVNHPEHQRAILKTCPSFIFFSITKSEPLGVKNIPLTEQRSLATDYRRMEEYGVINFIKYKKPQFSGDTVSMIPFSRFFINQDTGGAIKGNARSDLYFGYGKKAELSANHIYGLGEQYFLILK